MKDCFRTPKLKLRAPEPDDADFCYEVENDTAEWESTENYMPVGKHGIEEFIRNYIPDPLHTGQIRMIMTDVADGSPVGMADLYDINLLQGRAAVGIYVSRYQRRKGYALEALDALADYCGKHLGLRLLYAHIYARNEASVNLFAKAGYVECGRLREWFRRGNNISDAIVMMKKL